MEGKTTKPKVIRISTIPMSLNLLLRGQLRMLAEQYEVVAVSSPGDDLDEVERREGVRTVAVKMERHISLLRDFVALCRLIVLFRKEKPQIVHSLTPKAGLLAMMAAWACRVPVRIHTFTGLVFPTATGLKQRILIATDRLTCRCATFINPEGSGVKRDMEYYKITRKPLHIIGNGNINGVDLDYFCRTDEVLAEARKYREKGCFTFCFVGRMVGDKGINELVSAFLRLLREKSNVRLLLVGPFETELDPVSAETENHILHNSAIKFMGWQNDIRPFLAASDAFVFPSYREGFPNVVLQAGAMGLPCIVTDINGCNEIIENGVNGLIIPPRDVEELYQAMQLMVGAPFVAQTLSKDARNIISAKYDRKQLWKELLNVYSSLVE